MPYSDRAFDLTCYSNNFSFDVKNVLGKMCYEIKEKLPKMLETKDSVDFYWDPV